MALVVGERDISESSLRFLHTKRILVRAPSLLGRKKFPIDGGRGGDIGGTLRIRDVCRSSLWIGGTGEITIININNAFGEVLEDKIAPASLPHSGISRSTHSWESRNSLRATRSSHSNISCRGVDPRYVHWRPASSAANSEGNPGAIWWCSGGKLCQEGFRSSQILGDFHRGSDLDSKPLYINGVIQEGLIYQQKPRNSFTPSRWSTGDNSLQSRHRRECARSRETGMDVLIPDTRQTQPIRGSNNFRSAFLLTI